MSMVIFFVDQNKKNKSLSEILDIKKLMNVDRPIENANGLPNECYTSEKYLEYERNKIFCDKWTVIGVGSSVPELRHVVRRAFIIEKFPYSEIQDNTISKSIVPIDMLRLKLSFFGALKFDPRSDKWLRICMFQGAPLPSELKNYDEQWVYKTIN